MSSLYAAAILGVVEGLTEFLPVSSTGHLIITGNLLGFTGDKAASFEVAIQLGAILAVVLLYRSFFWGLLFPQQGKKFSGIRGFYLLFLTSLPASVLGLITHDAIKKYLFNPYTVAWALLVGALMILFVERKDRKPNCFTLDEITPKLALCIGCFQCLALWPGFSRSASTIMGGMILGAKRKIAAEYSFIAAVPIMFAATGYDMLKSYKLFTMADIPFLSVGFIVSFIFAWIAVKGFIYLLGKLTLRPFAYYRLALAPLILFFWS